MKHSVFPIVKLASAVTMLMLASACSPTSNSETNYFPSSSMQSSGSWSGSNAGAARGAGYFYEYDGI